MIWYTLMPFELMFPQDATAEEQTQPMTVLYNNIPILVEQVSPMEYKVVRVISTDPAHFMDESCGPGQILSMNTFVNP
ncbi:YlzJ-like family protein [Fictibacillus enclensis]|uniref:YlzJ-like family protein n=1 Tax=Fictibacillus enclensis TaxID=1017270 RepID=UPI0024C0790D|nr:YlzJ-like family protein [Fictibacillus enclensis]MDM5338125.1 YlzJ-like family protein [Fictibacillus enclensis]WHY74470.1 YlzJ-like family protein [Fictibacillus enclensis]